MDLVAGAAIAFVVAALTTPVGVSGAFLLVPAQLSILGANASQVAPTNLLFNVVSMPGALARYAKNGGFDTPLATKLIAGSLPGVVVGSILRVQVFTGEQAFLVIVAVVLAPIGAWLLFGKPAASEDRQAPVATFAIVALAFASGLIGGLYGIGGGSIVAPVLVGMGLSVVAVAPSALLATFVTSIAGLASFLILARSAASFAPDWALGVALGAGGLAGGYVGARMQPAISETVLRRVLGAITLALAVRYAGQAAF